jgi:YegS/Rv2252/BmrU family lipid kinase
MKRKILFIVNPHSGVGRHKKVARNIEQFLDHDFFQYQIKETHQPGHATTLAREAVENKTDVVVVSGGDGSVNEVVKGIYGSDTILGIIPTGSGNGFARHLNIPLRVSRAIQLINEFSVSRIDAGFVNDQIFVSTAGVGFDAMIAHEFSKLNHRGFLSYFRLIAKHFPNYKPGKVVLQIKDEKIKEKPLMVTIGNSSQYGYNTSLTPEASLHDGLLDVAVIKKPPLLMTPIITHMLLFKHLNHSEYVKILRTNELIIKHKSDHPVNIDGEPAFFPSRKLYFRVEKETIRIIVPK